MLTVVGVGYHGDVVNTQELAQTTSLTRAQVDSITDVVHAAPQWYPGSTKEIRVCYHYPPPLTPSIVIVTIGYCCGLQGS